MTSSPDSSKVAGPAIHIASIKAKGPKQTFLILRQLGKSEYSWFEEAGEVCCGLSASSITEAIRLAIRKWKMHHFTPISCGFRFTLPERDEIGRPAYFFEMITSYKSMTGVYRDQKLGHNCIVNKASTDALDLWHRLENEGRLEPK